MTSNAKKEFLNKTKIRFYKELKLAQSKLKNTKEIEGYASGSIVGEKNYPFLKIHSVSNENKKSSFFKLNNLVKKNYNDIIKIKAKSILGSTQETYIKKTKERVNNELQNIYKSKKAIEFTSEFEKEIKFDKIIINKLSGILGSKNELKSIILNQNPPTSKQIEKFTQKDIKSKQAIISLYEKGINEQQIINLLALGSFGIDINKKLVPTKWAITAYDQTIEKHLFNKIKKNKIIQNYEIYLHQDKGNFFIIILTSDILNGEIIEKFEGGSPSDYFDHENKLDKKEPATSGGYFSTKLGIFEHLCQKNKQAGIISIRIIEDYDIHLGVIFVRECARQAMKNRIFKCSNKNELNNFLAIKFPKHHNLFNQSKYLQEQRKQKRIRDFI